MEESLRIARKFDLSMDAIYSRLWKMQDHVYGNVKFEPRHPVREFLSYIRNKWLVLGELLSFYHRSYVAADVSLVVFCVFINEIGVAIGDVFLFLFFIRSLPLHTFLKSPSLFGPVIRFVEILHVSFSN